VREDVAALLVVEHARDRAEFDRGEHQEHRARRIAHHDAHHVTATDAAFGQRGRIAVDGLVGVAVAQCFVVEADENLVAVARGTFLKYPADDCLADPRARNAVSVPRKTTGASMTKAGSRAMMSVSPTVSPSISYLSYGGH